MLSTCSLLREACSAKKTKRCFYAGVRLWVGPAVDDDRVPVESDVCEVRRIVRALRERCHSRK